MGHGEEEVSGRVPQRIRSVFNSASMNSLPDDLLVQILSLLPTKLAASTSILSKRWKTLFCYQHHIDFDDSLFSLDDEWKRSDIIQTSFKNVVDRTLNLRHGNHIKKFSLKCKDGDNKVHVDRWICKALEYNVSELHLSIEALTRNLDIFPSKLFTSTTLVKLSLGTKIYIESFPSDTFLPSLKALFLDTVRFKGEILSNVLLVACPSLEDLTIYDNLYSAMPTVISSKTIKRLSITYNSSVYDDCSSIISLDTPSVVDLYYSDYVRRMSPRCKLDSLSKATLDLHLQEVVGKHHRWKIRGRDVTNLISGICNVKTLHLTSSAVEAILICRKGGLPMFDNLVDLVFSSDTSRGWIELFPLVLEQSPNLKTVVLSDLNYYTFGYLFAGIRIPTNNQVEMLRIMEYRGSVQELTHINDFLLKMQSLETVEVRVDDPKKVQQITEDLLKLPTAASKVKIQVI